MKARCLLTLTACFAFAPLHGEDKVTPTPKPTKVHVTVIAQDVAKQPLAGVAIRGVELWTRGPSHPFQPSFEGTTDDQGRWTAEIPFGEYTVLATRGPLVAGPQDNNQQNYWSLNARTLTREIPLTLREGGDLNVRVIDAATNAPLPKTQLLLEDGHVAETDEHGQAKLRGLIFGEHALVGIKPPYSDRRADFNNAGQSYMEVQVAMTPGFMVRGQVRDSNGKPVTNAVVRDHYSGNAIHCDRHHCITDAEGRYEIGWYSKAKPLWSFGVEHKDFANQNKQDLQPPAEGDVVTWDFVLEQGYAIAGIVTDEKGLPLKNAEVRYGGASAWVNSRTVRSGDDGHFRIAHIAVNRTELVIAHANGFAPSFVSTTPGKDKDVPQLEFKLEKGLVVKGRVVDRDGKPIAGASFSPMWEMDGHIEYAVERRFGSDKDGNFTLEDLPAGGNYLDIYGHGFSDIRHMRFDPIKPLLITVDKPGAIVGKVLDGETGQPIANFNVRLGSSSAPRVKDEPAASYSAHLSAFGQDCRAQDGRFVIEELVTRAPHAVLVSAEGYLVASEDRVLAMPVDDKDWPQVFRLKRGHTVKGQTKDAQTGQPVAGVQILVMPNANLIYALDIGNLREWRENFAYQNGIETRSGADGHFAFAAEDQQKAFFCVIRAAGYAPVAFAQSASELDSPWQVSLQRGITLKGSLRGVMEQIDENSAVTVSTGDYSTGSLKLTPTGDFQANDLPPGPVLVTATRVEGDKIVKTIHAAVILKAGEINTVDLTKNPTATLHCTVKLDGKPIEGIHIAPHWEAFERKPNSPWLGAAITDKEGVAIIPNLPCVPIKIRFGAPELDKKSIHFTGTGTNMNPIVDLTKGGDQNVLLEWRTMKDGR